MNWKILLVMVWGFVPFLSSAQNDDKLIQFSGVVVSGDSLNPLPFTTVIISNTARGTISDYYGFFSFVANKGDTIHFSHVGYRDAEYVIPDTLSTNRYSMIQIMRQDTLLLRETAVYPWPSPEQFKEAFLALQLPEDDYTRAARNLRREAMREQIDATPMDGSENFKVAQHQYQTKLYYAGQAPPVKLFDPIAWAKFIQAWKAGDFKRKDKDGTIKQY